MSGEIGDHPAVPLWRRFRRRERGRGRHGKHRGTKTRAILLCTKAPEYFFFVHKGTKNTAVIGVAPGCPTPAAVSKAGGRVNRFRANMAHITKSLSDSGLEFQVKAHKSFQVVPSSFTRLSHSGGGFEGGGGGEPMSRQIAQKQKHGSGCFRGTKAQNKIRVHPAVPSGRRL